MRSSHRESTARESPATQAIARELEEFLRQVRVRRVYVAGASVAPPMLAYVTHFPRLYIALSGDYVVELAQNGATSLVQPSRGDAVFVPENAWDKPNWQKDVRVLTFLFGTRHIGISLVEHKGDFDNPVKAIKTNVHGSCDGLTQSILHSLMFCTAERSDGPLSLLLTESLLHSCLSLLRISAKVAVRKAVRTYESVCLYVQENFQRELTRDKVAEHFGLAPNHISRLFHQQAGMRFHDYLNNVRMNRAKFMLRNYRSTLKEIAANCGYNDVAYFCRLFKKMNDETPTEFRAVENGTQR